MNLLQTVQTSYEEGSYVMDGCLTNGNAALALSLSNCTVRLYDLNTSAFLFDLKDHNQRITDLVTSPAQPSLLYSSQADTGVMISDVRQGKAVHFLTDMCGSGAQCNTVSVSPSGTQLLVGVDQDLHILDTRTWTAVHRIEQLHLDEITRARFLDESTVCTSGEDQMINFINASAAVVDDDVLLQAINCGEVITKMTCHPEVSAVAMVGTCENAYVCSYDLEQPEVRFPRPDFSTYLVDWCLLGGQLHLVSGVRDDDGNAGALSVLDWSTRQSWTLPFVHKELARVAVGFSDHFITAGEDGLLAFWKKGELSPEERRTASLSAGSRGGNKERSFNHGQEYHGGNHGSGGRGRGGSGGNRGGGRGRGGPAGGGGGGGGRGYRHGNPY